MTSETRFGIGELADAAGLSRRAIRFYVQRGLLPPPLGLGRGRHYGREHVEQLQEIQKLQVAGHSLDAIKRLLDGGPAPVPEKTRSYTTRTAERMTAQLWTRIRLADGAELQLDTAKHNLDIKQMLAIQHAVAEILQGDSTDDSGNGSVPRKKGKQ